MSNRGQNIRDRISDTYEKTPGYLTYDITEACGQEMDELDHNLEDVEKKWDVDNLTGSDLTKYVLQRKGIQRKAAGYAEGIVTVAGTGTVYEGDVFETENGVQFKAKENITVSGSAEVPIIAAVPGNAGMVGAGSITQMPVTLEGINSCTNAAPTSGGYDAETDDDLRDRFYFALQNPVTSANAAAYKQWALEVTGVGSAEVFPLGHGNNTVDVVIIDTNKTAADNSLISAVQEHIDPNHAGAGEGKAPIGAHCYVSSATEKDIDITADLTLLTGAVVPDVEQRIKEILAAYLQDIAFKSGVVSYARIGALILGTEGVADYTDLLMNEDTENVTIEDREVAVLGTVVFNYD